MSKRYARRGFGAVRFSDIRAVASGERKSRSEESGARSQELVTSALPLDTI